MSLSSSERAALVAAIEKTRAKYLRAAAKLATVMVSDGKPDAGPVRALRQTLEELERALETAGAGGAQHRTPSPAKPEQSRPETAKSEPETVRPTKGPVARSSIDALKAELSSAVKQKSEPSSAPPAEAAKAPPAPKPQGGGAIPSLEDILASSGDGATGADEVGRPTTSGAALSPQEQEAAALAEAVKLSEGGSAASSPTASASPAASASPSAEASPAASAGSGDMLHPADDGDEDENAAHVAMGMTPGPFDPNDAMYSILKEKIKVGETTIDRIDRSGNILTGSDDFV